MPSIEKRLYPEYARPRKRSRPSTSVRRRSTAFFSSSVSGARERARLDHRAEPLALRFAAEVLELVAPIAPQ